MGAFLYGDGLGGSLGITPGTALPDSVVVKGLYLAGTECCSGLMMCKGHTVIWGMRSCCDRVKLRVSYMALHHFELTQIFFLIVMCTVLLAEQVKVVP